MSDWTGLKVYQKPTKIRSKKLTRAAKGNSCTAHTPDCNANPETVVFAHAPSEGKGVATKSDDFFGAFLCYGCHTYLDEKCSRKEANGYWLRAIYRTQKIWFNEGILKVD